MCAQRDLKFQRRKSEKVEELFFQCCHLLAFSHTLVASKKY